MASFKMNSLARQLTEDLGLRLPSLGAVQSFDGSGNALVTLGTLGAGNQCAYIRCMEQVSIQTDALGLTQRSYGPHVIQIVLETSAIANVSLMLESNKLALLGSALRYGVKVELYMIGNGNAPAVGAIIAADLKGTFDSLREPFISSM